VLARDLSSLDARSLADFLVSLVNPFREQLQESRECDRNLNSIFEGLQLGIENPSLNSEPELKHVQGYARDFKRQMLQLGVVEDGVVHSAELRRCFEEGLLSTTLFMSVLQ
jgi:hypothetical protein